MTKTIAEERVPCALEVSAVSTVSVPTRQARGSAVELHARRIEAFDERLAHAVSTLQAAALEHAGRIVQATSLGAEDMVITDLIARHDLSIPVGTLDTGVLHAQTLGLVETIKDRYGIAVEVHRPDVDAVDRFVEAHGERAMYASVDLRKQCCAVRKLVPLARLLDGRSAWVTGLRREQSTGRSGVPFSERDGNGRIKLNPLADWSWNDVWHYIAEHDVPYNPLHDSFYPSIGCAPCTRAIAIGEDLRAGRWWWENEAAKECGLHSPRSGATAPAGSRSEPHGRFVPAQADFGAAEAKAANAAGRSQNASSTNLFQHS